MNDSTLNMLLDAYHFCAVATPGRLQNLNLLGRNGRDTLYPVGHKDRKFGAQLLIADAAVHHPYLVRSMRRLSSWRTQELNKLHGASQDVHLRPKRDNAH